MQYCAYEMLYSPSFLIAMHFEPDTRHKHVRIILVSIFLGFIDQIRNSQIIIPKMLLSHIHHDVRSATRLNLGKIMLETNKVSVNVLRNSDITELFYHSTPPDEKWKVVIMNEIIQVRDNTIEFEGFEYEELTEILEPICVS